MRKHVRLRKNEDFVRCYRSGKTYKGSLVVLHVYDRRDDAGIRIGFSVSRKVGKAVQRNLVKRWMREAVRPLVPVLPLGLDIVFSARVRALNAGFGALREDILSVMLRSGVLSKEAGLVR